VLDGPKEESVPPDETTTEIDSLRPGLTYSFVVQA
jgi:hypothetical protein